MRKLFGTIAAMSAVAAVMTYSGIVVAGGLALGPTSASASSGSDGGDSSTVVASIGTDLALTIGRGLAGERQNFPRY